MFKRVVDKIYYTMSDLCYKWSKNKNYKYRGAISSNSLLKGHNTLFQEVTCIGCELGEYTYVQKNSFLLNTKIGKFCSIADHVRTGFGNHPYNMISTWPGFYYDTTPELRYTFFKGEPKVRIIRNTGGVIILLK